MPLFQLYIFLKNINRFNCAGIIHYLSEKMVLFLAWQILVKSAPFFTKVLFKPIGCFSPKLVRGSHCLEDAGLITWDHRVWVRSSGTKKKFGQVMKWVRSWVSCWGRSPMSVRLPSPSSITLPISSAFCSNPLHPLELDLELLTWGREGEETRGFIYKLFSA